MKYLPLFDGHCDTVSAMLMKDSELLSNDLHIDLHRANRFRPYAQFFAIFAMIKPGINHLERLTWSEGETAFDDQYRIFLSEIEKNKDAIAFCRNYREAELAIGQGRSAAFLSVEGGEILGCSIEGLEKAYNLGVRSVMLTWNFENKLSGSNAEGYDKGLTDLGRRFVKRCEELGVIVDVSHLSEAGFWDIMEVAEKPVIASHSNSKALCDNSRNLTNRQFRAIADSGGVTGINLYAGFLDENPTVQTAVDHIEHFIQLDGAKNISIGADFDGCDTLPEGIGGVEDLYKIAEGLLKKNYTEALVCDIFYNNLKRVVVEICGI